MIVLETPFGLEKTRDWKERLERMTVPHQMVTSSIKEAKLSEGKQLVTGVAAIEQFLKEYEADVKFWNQDRCDMWFLDE